jgi:hypothetical protein
MQGVTCLRQIAVGTAVLFAMLIGSAAVAKADPFTLTNGSSVTVTYTTSNSSVTGTATYTLNGNLLTIEVKNTSSVPSGQGVITGFGFNTSPNITVNSSSYLGAGSGWTYSTNGGGLGGFEHRFSVSGIGNGINAGQSVIGSMVLSTSPTSLIIDSNKLHVQNIPPNGGSEKPQGVVTIPEPATMLLLGTGLVGLAAGIRRRRQKLD